MTIHKSLYPRYGIERLYVSKTKAGRVIADIEDSVDETIQ